MGFTVGAIHWFIDMKKRLDLSGDCFSLGRYNCHFKLNQFLAALVEQGIVPLTDSDAGFPYRGKFDIDLSAVPSALARFIQERGGNVDAPIRGRWRWTS